MTYEIPISEVRPGDILLCDNGKFSMNPKNTNIIGPILSFFIGIFDSEWLKMKRKPWHCRLVISGYGRTAIVLEALAGGVQQKTIDYIPLEKQRAYRWFDSPINAAKLKAWVDEHEGKPYDVLIYFWTAVQYLFRALWNRRIPRLLDDKYTCWELVMEACEDFDKPMNSKRDCPLITDLCRALHIITPTTGENRTLSVIKERNRR